MTPEPHRVTSLAELDALVGRFIMREEPEIHWEDIHGYFKFHSEIEARRALQDPYFQRFLPHVDWRATELREVHVYRHYSADHATNWQLAEQAAAQFGPMLMWRETGLWHAAFGSHADAEARTPTVAICLAALRAAGVKVEVIHDPVDAELSAYDPCSTENSGSAASPGR